MDVFILPPYLPYCIPVMPPSRFIVGCWYDRAIMAGFGGSNQKRLVVWSVRRSSDRREDELTQQRFSLDCRLLLQTVNHHLQLRGTAPRRLGGRDTPHIVTRGRLLPLGGLSNSTGNLPPYAQTWTQKQLSGKCENDKDLLGQ